MFIALLILVILAGIWFVYSIFQAISLKRDSIKLINKMKRQSDETEVMLEACYSLIETYWKEK